jgi:hypothetical protein
MASEIIPELLRFAGRTVPRPQPDCHPANLLFLELLPVLLPARHVKDAPEDMTVNGSLLFQWFHVFFEGDFGIRRSKM